MSEDHLIIIYGNRSGYTFFSVYFLFYSQSDFGKSKVFFLVKEVSYSRVYLLFYPSVVVQTVKRLPAMQETWVRSLGWEDPLEEGMTVHSSILAWGIPWTEEPCGLQSMGSQRIGQD